jgi:hypothetical protein
MEKNDRALEKREQEIFELEENNQRHLTKIGILEVKFFNLLCCLNEIIGLIRVIFSQDIAYFINFIMNRRLRLTIFLKLTFAKIFSNFILNLRGMSQT